MKKLNGVFRIDGKLATMNSSPGFRVYDEKLIKKKSKEYRLWEPYRSKLAAGILKGLRELPLNENSNVLYLGASSGTTASHIADICHRGMIYCIEFSPRMMRDLIQVARIKKNMIPIIGDARKPETYMHSIARVDFIYQDVAQPDQAEILIRNSNLFLPEYAMIAIKARSINTARKPKDVFREELRKLEESFEIIQKVNLQPYERDHILVSLRYNKKKI